MHLTTPPSVPPGDRTPPGLLDLHVESFVDRLRAAGYARRSLRKRRYVANSFVRWTRNKQLAVRNLDESHVATFLDRLPRRSKERFSLERAAMRLFLRHLRADAGVSTPPRNDSSPADELRQRYVDYLRNERGLAENSIRVYSPRIHDFLAEQVIRTGTVSPGAFDALTVRNFLLNQIRGRSGEYSRLLTIALRSFFGFLYLRGETAINLSQSVPTFRRWRQAGVPAFLTPEEVERVLAGTDRSTQRGRRDHAILLLLARLGFRGGEVVTLELGDIRWRTGEIIVRGKGRMVDCLPLLSDVGEALGLYLCKDRGESSSRRVFLRMFAPRLGLTGPAAVGSIARRAIAQAGIHPSGRGAAHLFRHSLATRMIRHGASITEISEVLRHRSQNTTEIYAKVAFEALRGVTRPWPGSGGAR